MATINSSIVVSSSKPEMKPDGSSAALKKCISLLKANEQVPKNILLIGRSAAGKSSLINLFRSALTNVYEEIAIPGISQHGSHDAVTTHLQYFPNMGLSSSELSSFREEHGFNPAFQLPTLIDMPGMDDFKSGNDKILKYVLDGAVPSETDVTKSVTRFDFDENSMRRNAIDRIIIVISISQDIPEKFLEEVMSTICFTEGKRKRIPYIVVFTHTDCVQEGISSSMVRERKRIALGVLNLGENAKLNSHDVICYSDKDPASDEDCWRYKIDPAKQNEALHVLCKLFRRRYVIDDRAEVNRGNVITPVVRAFSILNWRTKAVLILILSASIFYFYQHHWYYRRW